MFIWFMLFVYIVLGVYFLWRLIHWLKIVVPLFKHKRLQAVIITLYSFFASSLILGGLLPNCAIQLFFRKLGNYWLGTFIYIIFFTIIADIIVLILKLVNKKKNIPILEQKKGAYYIGLFTIVASVAFSVYGFAHAQKLIQTNYQASIPKNVAGTDNLKIALVADWHLGYSVGCDQMQRMVDMINAMDADVVIVAGDIYDNDYDALDNPEMLSKIISSIKSKYGVYAVYGNHDVSETLIGGFSVTSKKYAFRDPRLDEFLKKSNVTVLEDKAVTIANGEINLVGRVDGEKAGDGTSDRKSVADVLDGVDMSKPVIMIEHEPSNLSGIADAGVDVTLSGHTHDGQFFPLNLALPLAWDNYFGELKVGNMYSYVTSGVGVYGPNMRVMSTAEVMEVNLYFN